MPRLLERIDAALNPLMVKEAHQSFRNRLVLGVGLLALGVPLLMIAFALIGSAYEASSETAGRSFFGMVSGFFGLIALIAVPGRAAQQFQGEIKSRTIDLILLTGLSPWDLASGRFQAAGLQLVVMLAFVTPFAVASTLMGGIGIERVAGSLLLILIYGLAQCSAALLAVSTLLVSRRLGALALIAFVFQMFVSFSSSIVLISAAVAPTRLAVMLWSSALIVTGTLLFLRMSADLITPSAQRSYARSKLIMLAMLGMFFLPLWVSALAAGMASSEEKIVLLVSGMFWFCGFSLLWAASMPRRASGGRFGAWLGDGYAATTLYVLVTLIVIATVAQLQRWPAWVALPFAVYFVFFVGLAALIQTLWLVRTSEGFFAGLLLCGVLDVLATAVIEAGHGWGSASHVPVAAVFLPMSWLQMEERALSPWLAAPALVGALAMFVAHTRRAKLEYE
jgi:hypothetical protein